MLTVIKLKDCVRIEIEPHNIDLVANYPEECFKQHLTTMYKRFLEEYNKAPQGLLLDA